MSHAPGNRISGNEILIPGFATDQVSAARVKLKY